MKENMNLKDITGMFDECVVGNGIIQMNVGWLRMWRKRLRRIVGQ